MTTPLASNALTTLAALKDELGISVSTFDDRCTRYINVASQAVEEYCRHSFGKAVITGERYAPSGTLRLVLEKTPLLSIEQITIGEGDGPEVLDAGDYYIEDAAAGIVTRNAIWRPNDLAIRYAPSQDPVPFTGPKIIRVNYTAGYVLPNDGGTRSLPYDLEEAALVTAVSIYRSRGADRRVQAESLGDASVTYRQNVPAQGAGMGGFIPDEVLATLDKYRRFENVSSP